MKTKNKFGSNTEPCGTPDVIDIWEDFWFSNTTVCDLLYRNALIQWMIVSSDLLFTQYIRLSITRYLLVRFVAFYVQMISTSKLTH